MEPNTEYRKWSRKPGTGPGHPRIYVLVKRPDWSPAPADSRKPNEIQCATEDRIPFVLPIERLRAHYSPESSSVTRRLNVQRGTP